MSEPSNTEIKPLRDIEAMLSQYIYILEVSFTPRVTRNRDGENASRTLRLKLSQHGHPILKNAGMIYCGAPSFILSPIVLQV